MRLPGMMEDETGDFFMALGHGRQMLKTDAETVGKILFLAGMLPRQVCRAFGVIISGIVTAKGLQFDVDAKKMPLPGK